MAGALVPCQAVGNSGRRRQVQDVGTQCRSGGADSRINFPAHSKGRLVCFFTVCASSLFSPLPPQAALAATAVPSNPEFIQHAHL